MRALLAAFAAIFVLAMSGIAQAQKPDTSAPAPQQEQCTGIDAVRVLLAQRGEQERAYLEGARARPLLEGIGAPPRARAVAVFGSTSAPTLVVVLFDERGCAFAVGEFNPADIARFLGGA